MKPEELNRGLGRIIETAPALPENGPLSPDVMKWAAQASALIGATGEFSLVPEVQVAINGLHFPNRRVKFEQLKMILHKALALTELELPPRGPTGPSGGSNPDMRGLNGPTGPNSDQVVPLKGVAAVGRAGEIRSRIEDGFPVGASTDPNPPFIVREPPPNAPIDTEASLNARLAAQESSFETLAARVALLEAAFSGRQPAGLGHNRGPDLDGNLDVDEKGIQDLIALLKEQRATKPVDLVKLAEAAEIANPAVNKWRERLDEFARGALKGAGFEAGKEAFKQLEQTSWFAAVHSALEGVYRALVSWMAML